MNEIANRFLLAGDKFMFEFNSQQPRFTYSVCGPFTKCKKKIKMYKETGNLNHLILTVKSYIKLELVMIYLISIAKTRLENLLQAKY